ncbi:MAG: hypothetical protein HYR85_04925 [Planctomycetes bacterium]|nr:hypothetical protein [Planctomycetota bacterium]
MPAVRAFYESDVPEVADLFVRSFRPGGSASAAAVAAYTRRAYFANPWRDDAYPCLVHEGRDGRIDGFLGVIPRPVRFRGAAMTAAVAGNFMVRADASGRRDPLAAVNLVRAFFAGTQDVSLTDTANDLSQSIWQACGGVTARMHSFTWIRPIRPFRLAVEELAKRGDRSPLHALGRMVCPFADPFAARMAVRPLRRAADECVVDELRASDLRKALSAWCRHELSPDDDEASLEWLLEEVGRKNGAGIARRSLVRDAHGVPIGWYVFYLKPGGISEVLGLGADPRHADRVVSRLIVDAAKEGAIALRCRSDPELVTFLSRRYCFFYNAGAWVLAHSRHTDVLNTIHSGSALLGGLHGETWTRFTGDSFDEEV